MKSVIINKEHFCFGIPERILEMLPYRISDAIRKEADRGGKRLCEEIRLRCGRMSGLRLSGGEERTIELSTPLSQNEIDLTVDRLCGGSLYAHGDTIKQGYISVEGGIRAGVSGRAAYDGGKMVGISEINGICIRLPHGIKVDASPVCELLRKSSFSSGVLIYSPPGVGKTTLLRSVASSIAESRETRVVVVDSRGELEYGLVSPRLSLDVLSGYSKAEGIEIALRTLNAGLIVCDEIGNNDDVKAICDAAVGGAALLASAHAADTEGLMSKKNIRALIDAGVFSSFVGIAREGTGYRYTITSREELQS